MKRGDIYFANLDPTVGAEIRKKRPVIIVSNDANNKMALTVTIVPITSNVKKVYPFEVFLDKLHCGLTKDSKAQCHQVRTISKLRIQGERVGRIDGKIIMKLEDALKLHLGIL